MIMSGLFLCEMLKEFIRDSNRSMEWRYWVFRHYGTSSRAVYTLFEVTLSGCWPTYFRPLIDKVSVWYAVFAIFYVTMVVFAVIRIITALFLKKTLQAAD